MQHEIIYNTQTNNPDFSGKFPGFWQCFTTSAWMFMSFYTSNIKANDDQGLSNYLDDVETEIGKPGIAEKVKQKYSWITGRTSLWWLVQQQGIESWLWRNGIKGGAIFKDQNLPFNELTNLIDKGPVIIGTNKFGGLSGGHIILAVGYDVDNIICHDPFGDAASKYKNANGAFVKYPKKFLQTYTGSNVRCIYWICDKI